MLQTDEVCPRPGFLHHCAWILAVGLILASVDAEAADPARSHPECPRCTAAKNYMAQAAAREHRMDTLPPAAPSCAALEPRHLHSGTKEQCSQPAAPAVAGLETYTDLGSPSTEAARHAPAVQRPCSELGNAASLAPAPTGFASRPVSGRRPSQEGDPEARKTADRDDRSHSASASDNNLVPPPLSAPREDASESPGHGLPQWASEATGLVTDTNRVPDSSHDVGRWYALLINGGGTKEQNYQSHLLHLRQITDLLLAAGVPASRIYAFSSDGSDPGRDLAVRGLPAHQDFWIVRGTRAERYLRPALLFEDSELPPLHLRPATRAALKQWFATTGRKLRPGDALLVFVTDHGTKNPDDPDNNWIVLWGPDEKLSVDDFATLLDQLRPGVRVLTIMSQCFSGSFARLAWSGASRSSPPYKQPRDRCGFFSTVKERPAYGCYAENLGRKNIGHAFHYLQAWAETRSTIRAHEETLVRDATPDVPLRSSDEYLRTLLLQAARHNGEELSALVDRLLARAWEDAARWEPEVRLIDRIASAYGLFTPRTLADLEERTRLLPDIAEQLRNVSSAWRGAWQDASEANWGRFTEAHPEWQKRLAALDQGRLTDHDRRQLAEELIPELLSFTRASDQTYRTLRLLRRKARAAAAASYRLEVRQGALLRLERQLTRIAGLLWLERHASPKERETFASLVRCEEWLLPDRELPHPQLLLARPFPPFDHDVTRAQRALPAWMGIQFREPREKLRTELGLSRGAAAITTVYPDSPAARAGIQQGDILLGPPEAPFRDKGEVRRWIMLSRIGEPKQLQLLRDGKQHTTTLTPAPYPLKWPELPGPPAVGSVAPALPQLSAYRGELPAIAQGSPVLLFFWASWCAACKAALPELLAFERERAVPVLAITDEPPERLEAFFRQPDLRFPDRVAIDDYRKAFVAYGVSGTPTFVLLDGAGRVQASHTGYDRRKGLPFEGWKWAP